MQSDRTAPVYRAENVKQLIDDLEKKYGSLRKAAQALGTSHQKLANWRDGVARGDYIETLEKIRKELGISDSKMWKRIKGQ